MTTKNSALIQDQVSVFLAQGGKIEKLPGYDGAARRLKKRKIRKQKLSPKEKEYRAFLLDIQAMKF